MVHYSTSDDIARFLEQAGDNPLFVCDMDGNVMQGYSLISGQTLALGSQDDPQKQSIPFGTSLAQLESLAAQGVLTKGVFAEKAMDARLPQNLVDFVNDNVTAGAAFKIAFLTSRGANDARKLLVESGVSDIDKVTLVADSGATLYIGGQKTEVRKLTQTEAAYLKGVELIAHDLHAGVSDLVKVHAPDYQGSLPSMFVEHKGIATNIHYREILNLAGQGENSPLDKAIGAFIKERLEAYVTADASPKEQDGKPTFKTLDGPATVEMKIASVNKGHGLAAIMDAALSSNVQRPSAVIFTGDDVAKGNGTPGTDWFAMNAIRGLGLKHGIATMNIHTHHMASNDNTGTIPDANKSPETLSAQFPKPPIDLVVRTPAELGQVILRAHDRIQPAAQNVERSVDL